MKAYKKIRNQLFRLTHAGSSCYCLYCQATYRRFMHEGVKKTIFRKYRIAGGGHKKNVKCPNCGSTDRGRLLYLFFTLRTDIFMRKTRVLHISPNRNIAEVLYGNKNIEYVCGGLQPDEFKDLGAVRVDVTKINFGDNEFDVVICNHVLEHVADDAGAMREIHRVLKTDGFAVLQVPLALDLEKTLEDSTLRTCKERKSAFGQSDHVRLYGMDYFDRLHKAGFRVVRDNPFTNQWPADLQKHCLDKNEDVIIAYKN